MNMENYRDVFIEEAEENVGNLNNALLVFEKNTEDLTPINELFRAAHTLKGMSATMGYDKLAGFTHVLEEALEALRSGAVEPTKEIINLLFKSIDTVGEFVSSIKNLNVDAAGGYTEVADEIKANLKGAAAEEKKPEKKPVEQAAGDSVKDENMSIDPDIAAEAALRGLKAYRISVVVSKGCAFKSVRAFMVSRNLSEKGDIIKSVPHSKDIEEGNFEDSFYLGYISSLTADEIEKMIYKIAEIESVSAREIIAAKEPGETAAEETLKETQDKKAAGKPSEERQKQGTLSQSVRVNIEKLDLLMNLVGELVINKVRLDQISKDAMYEQLKETVEEFDRIIDELQIEVTEVRMLPVSHIFDRFPRAVRDLASGEGKEIELEVTGGDIEIDRTVLEEINEPILHLIRNSIAHGIETPSQREIAGKVKKGIIKLSARRERNSVIIEVSDDGRGIDVLKVKNKAVEKGIIKEERIRNMPDDEIVNIVSMPGFSTAEKTDGLSGRGVGVDVVKTKVESFGGIFKIENYPGEGVKFILKLPLTLAIIQSLLVKAAGGIYAIPVIHTTEILEIMKKDIKVIQKKRVILLREEVIPVLSLAELLGKKREEKEVLDAVIVEARDKRIALEVDKVLGQQEVAIKSLGDFLKYAKGFSGVTILGDGSVSLIVDIQALLENVNMEELTTG